jgi:hypothetical protein
LDRKETDDALCTALTAAASDHEVKVMLQHYRLGHLSFDTMSKIFPEEMKNMDKGKLVCDACEYGKHTRTSYVSHLLEVARSLMFTMNVPKFLWSEAVTTATYLINRMPSRVLGMKTPYEMIYGKNEFIVPPKVLGVRALSEITDIKRENWIYVL